MPPLPPVGRLVALAALLAGPAGAQVNTERMRSGLDTSAVTFALDASLAFASGNVEYLLASVGGRADLVRDDVEAFLVGRTSLSRADGVVFLNQSFAHLRATRGLAGPLAVEAFAQAEQNAQRLLQERFLGGAGLRLTLFDRASRAALGVTPMVEFERLDASAGEPAATAVRLSTYLAARLKISDWTSLSNVAYLQPQVGAPGDARVLNDLTLEVEMARGVRVRVGAHLRHDTAPPAGVEATDVEVRNGLVITLPAR